MAADSALHRQKPPSGDVTTTVKLPLPPAQPRSSRYKILKLHGRGGMGEIWLAEDEHIGRQVAFKRIRSDKEQVLERFFAEAQVTGQLEHPGIVPVHELGRDEDNQPFYVMRLIQGRTLKEVIAECHAANKRCEPDEELRWLRLFAMVVSLCRTTAFAHSRGVIHRDLKPDNVMIGQYGETLVLDWGLCKLLGQPEAEASESRRLSLPVKLSRGHGSTATQDGEIVGSPLYMSPEMADGRIAEEDMRTDVYLLGATLYEVLTNRPPRGGSTHQEIVELARTSPPVPPRNINPRVPRALEAICVKAMAYRSDDRYDSAQELADEIERFMAGEPVEAYPEPVLRRTWRWAVRRRAAIARGAIGLLVVAALAASLMALNHERARREEERAEAKITAKNLRAEAELAAKELADRQKLDRARQDAATFRELEETLHYQLADTTPFDDRVSITDPGAAEVTWKKIQEVLSHWRPGLADFPVEAGQAELQKEYAELVLWRVQSLMKLPLATDLAETLLVELQSIAELHPPPYSYRRQRADCLSAAGNINLADRELELVKSLRPAAFDFFLEGEQQRMAALTQVAADDDEAIGRPSRTFLKQAANSYQKCLDLNPQHFWAHLQKGRSHLAYRDAMNHRDEYEQALAHFNLAVAIRPLSPAAWTMRGLALGILGDFEGAKHDLGYAVEQKGHSVSALLNRGAVHLLHGKDHFADARQDFLAVKAEDPKNVPATYYVALLDFEQGQMSQALVACTELLQIAPGLRPALLLRLQIHLAQRDRQQAQADLALLSSPAKPALMQAADRCSLLLGLATGRGQRLALDLAEQNGLAAVRGGLKTATLFYDLGRVQWALNKPEQALASWESGLECEGSATIKALLIKNRGLKLVERGEFARAKEDYSKAAEISGDEIIKQKIRAEAHALLGYIAARQSDVARAEREAALAMAQIQNFRSWHIWYNLACAYTAMADDGTAHSEELLDIAILMIRNSIYQARRSGSLSAALRDIVNDDALKPLRSRQDFKDLVASPADL